MILRARVVLTMDGPPIENGALAIEGAFITDVGAFPEVKARGGGEIVDLGEQTVLPGLINAHCHLDYTILRGRISRQPSFADWIRQINAAKAVLAEEDYVRSIEMGFSEAKRFGTTSIVNLEAFPELLSQTAAPPIRTWHCAELVDVRKKVDLGEIVRNMRAACQRATDSLGGFGLAPHAPYTASAELYRRCSELAQHESLLLTTHLAESRDEMAMFRTGGGPLFKFMEAIGRPMDDCGLKTPLALFLEATQSNQDWLLAHVNELGEEDFERLRRANKLHIIHCPRSHHYFGHAQFPLQKLRAFNFNVCLGTDSLASNSDLSLFAEMQALSRTLPSLAPREILEMVTLNPAKALQLAHALGRIRPGYLADVIALSETPAGDVFECVISYDRPVTWMMINGRVVGDF